MSGPVPPIAVAVAMMIEIEMNIARIGADDGVETFVGVVVRADSLIGDGRRLVQLHVRRDRGPDQGNDEEEEFLAGQQVRYQ